MSEGRVERTDLGLQVKTSGTSSFPSGHGVSVFVHGPPLLSSYKLGEPRGVALCRSCHGPIFHTQLELMGWLHNTVDA